MMWFLVCGGLAAVFFGALMLAAAALGKFCDDVRRGAVEDERGRHARRSLLGVGLVWVGVGLSGCVGDNLADIAQAQAAVEAARAAQESAQAAQTAAAGLSMAVVAPWVVAILVVGTAAAWVWAVKILPAMRGYLTPQPPSRIGKGGAKTVVIRPRYEDAPAQLPEPKREEASLQELMELKMRRDLMRDLMHSDEERRY
jgi:hypothetical protein